MEELIKWIPFAKPVLATLSYLWSRYKKHREKLHNTSGAPAGADKVPNLTTGPTVNTCNEGGQMNGILNNSFGNQANITVIRELNINFNFYEHKNPPKE